MRKKLVASVIALMLMVSGAFAGEPTLVVIDGKLVKVDSIVQPKLNLSVPNSTVDLGEIMKLEGKLEGELPAFVKKTEYKWNVTEKGYVKQFWEQGNWVIFGTGIKSSTVRVACQVTLTYDLGKEEVIKKIEQTVDLQVGDPTPTPVPPNPTPNPNPPTPTPVPPNPTPNPTPTPPVPTPPAPLTGLAASARDWAVQVGPANKAQSAPVIANTLTSLSARIGNDASLSTPRQILMQTKTEINADLTKAGFSPADWDAWGAKLQDYAFQQYQSGGMKTAQDYKQAWLDLAAGLKAAAGQ